MESLGYARLAARIALEKQAEGVVILDMRSISTVTEFFVVCTAGSARHLSALKEHIETVLAQQGCAVWHTEGVRAAKGVISPLVPEPQWVLMDCGEIVVHLLDQQTRAFYRLEDLWADAPRVPLRDP